MCVCVSVCLFAMKVLLCVRFLLGCFDFAELMLLGFISLLLTVSQGTISKICVPEHVITNMLPCDLSEKRKGGEESNTTATTEHFQRFFTTGISGTARRLLAESTESQIGYCAKKVLNYRLMLLLLQFFNLAQV